MADNNPPLLSRKALVGGSEETTSGTAETISAALANTTCYDAKLEPLDMFADGARQPNGHYLGNIAAVRGLQMGQLTFRQELRYGDQFLAMLTGAGLAQISGGAYTPTSSFASRKTWTMALWEDGRKKQIYGAAADFTLEWAVGARLIANWTWTGIWTAPSDQAMPSQAPSTHTTLLYMGRGTTLTLGGAAIPDTSRGTLAMQNSLSEREDLTAATGLAHMFVSERNPQITLDTEARSIANGAPFAALLAGTEVALAFSAGDGDSPENTFSLAAPKVQRIGIADGDRGGRRVDEMTLQCNASTGDDEVAISATAGS